MRQGCSVVESLLDDRRVIAELADPVRAGSITYVIGCGSSYWVGTIAAHLLREAGQLAVPVRASEFVLSSYPKIADSTVVGFSQSGETSETVQALEAAGEAGAATVAVSNTAGSTLDELADNSYVTPAGTEEAILATKSVDAAVAAAHELARAAGDGNESRSVDPEACRRAFDVDVDEAGQLLADAEAAYAVGTGLGYGLAGEAATKLGEGPRLHATPLPALELRHGPMANVDGTPVVLVDLGTTGPHTVRDLLADLATAGARTIVVHATDRAYDADETVPVPATPPATGATLKVLQRLTLATAAARGVSADDPPALSKYVETSDLRQ